jgi:hypothetical protein
MDSSGSSGITRSDNGIDISNRSTDPLQPSRGGSSGLHLSSFRKKRNKVSTLSSTQTNSNPSLQGFNNAVTDPYHSPNLMEEYGSQAPGAHSRQSYKQNVSFSSSGDVQMRGNLLHGVSTRQSPSSMTGNRQTTMIGSTEGKRRSTLTKKAGGALELAPPSDF